MAVQEISEDEYAAMVFEDGDSVMIDMSNVEEMSFENVPKGIYNAEIDELSFEKSKAGQWMYALKLKITSGDYANRILFSWISFSPKALSGSKSTLKRIDPVLFDGTFDAKAIADQGILLGCPVRIKVEMQDYNGEQRSSVKSILAPAAEGSGEGNGFFG